MPWMNLAGWTVTGLGIMAVLEVLRVDRWMEPLSVLWLGTLYAGVLLMPLGMVAAAGHWPAVAVTLLGVAAPLGLLALRARPSPLPAPASDVPVTRGLDGEPPARSRDAAAATADRS